MIEKMIDLKDKRRVALILVAFIAGGAVPIQLVTLSFGYAQYLMKVSLGPKVIMVAHEFSNLYVPFAYVPAMVVLAAVAAYTRRKYPDVFRRIVVGFGAGAVATYALDSIRLMGVIHGWLPGDNVVMFGKMVTGSGNFAVYYPIGLLVHYLNGADFGLFYAFVWGKRLSYSRAVAWGIFWLIIVEIGMMTLPPMAPMVGMFGANYAWPHLFLLSLAAHIASGATIGLLVQHFLKDEDRGGLLPFLKGTAK